MEFTKVALDLWNAFTPGYTRLTIGGRCPGGGKIESITADELGYKNNLVVTRTDGVTVLVDSYKFVYAVLK